MKPNCKWRCVTLALAVLFTSLVAACGKGENPTPTTGASPSGPSVRVDGPSQARVLQTRSETRQFGTWSATCGNDGACWAFGFAPDFEAGWIRIALEPGPNARPEVRFGLWPDSDIDATSEIALSIDGVTSPALPAPESREDAPVGVIDGDLHPLLAAIVQGRSLTIVAGSSQAIPLEGAAAALLWIDEKQGRAGTATALMHRGDRPTSSIPIAPPLPVVPVAPPISQAGFGQEGQKLPLALRALTQVKTCIDESATPAVGDMVMSARLDPSIELWAVPCGAGAYNVTHLWYLTGTGGRDPRPLDLTGTLPGGGKPQSRNNTTVNGQYDPQTRTLSAFAQARGIGDCGTMQTWAWTGERFVLTAERLMTQCAGVPADLWPVSWRSR